MTHHYSADDDVNRTCDILHVLETHIMGASRRHFDL